ncbi:MAG: hypothetical protein AAGF12_35490 [Myxococcota bacterium]
MTSTRFVLALCSVLLLACGSETPSESAPEPSSASETPTSAAAAPAPSVEEAPPETIGRFGPFRLSYNSIAQDGQCFEFGHEDEDPEAWSSLRNMLTQSAERSGAGTDAVSTDARCPRTDRLSGSCEFMHGHIGYYSSGPSAVSLDEARTHCTENRGAWVS